MTEEIEKMISIRMKDPKLTGAEIKILVERGAPLFQALFDGDTDRAKLILELDKALNGVIQKW